MFTIYVGCVFSSKTSNMIINILKYKYHKNIVLFQHGIDDRYDKISTEKIVTHNKHVTFESVRVKDHKELLKLSKKFDIIGIDELQFYSIDIVDTIKQLMKDNKIVIASSLNADYRRKEWKTLSVCIPLATEIILLKGTCSKCLQNNATCSYNTCDNGKYQQIIKSTEKQFIPLCNKCYDEKYE